MDWMTARAADWLESVFRRVPREVSAVYVEYGDTYTPEMLHLICFNAFGFESLANGRFDPSNESHIGELGNFVWEPCDERGSQADTRSRGIDGKCADYFRPDECRFRADDYPGTDWMDLLRNAVQSPGVIALGAKRNIQLLIGEHDGQVIVVR